jgi:SAM-dependent methyltransferase
VADEYASGEYRYWQLSVPSPELTQAIEDGWFPTRGRVLDLGCGAGTEVGFLAGLGATSVGVDLSFDALTIASGEHRSGHFVQADVGRLPFAAGSFDSALDRGCLHYLPARRSIALRDRDRPCPSSGRPGALHRLGEDPHR